jgi:hypothetical protein
VIFLELSPSKQRIRAFSTSVLVVAATVDISAFEVVPILLGLRGFGTANERSQHSSRPFDELPAAGSTDTSFTGFGPSKPIVAVEAPHERA